METSGWTPWLFPTAYQIAGCSLWSAETCRNLSQLFRGRLTLVKVARWDPDKRWHMAVDAVAEIKRLGLRPLFLAQEAWTVTSTRFLLGPSVTDSG